MIKELKKEMKDNSKNNYLDDVQYKYLIKLNRNIN